MRTLKEIKAEYNRLMVSINQELPKVHQSEHVLSQLEDSVYDDSTYHDCNIYISYIEQMRRHAELVRNTNFYARSISSLLKEILEKIHFIKTVAHQFIDYKKIVASLVDLAIACEEIEGDLYSHGGCLDEKMLQLTSVCLREKEVQRLFSVIALEHQDVFSFCLPWFNYHLGRESNPLAVSLGSLPATQAVEDHASSTPG